MAKIHPTKIPAGGMQASLLIIIRLAAISLDMMSMATPSLIPKGPSSANSCIG